MADRASASAIQPVNENVAPKGDQSSDSRRSKGIPDNVYSPPAATHRTWRGKRVFDILGAVTIAAVCSPLIFAIFAGLMFTGGSAVFGHVRIGKGGKRFTCYKFRTMVPDAEQALEDLIEAHPDLRAEWILHHKLKDDPRVTRLGAFLRRTSLDELPQLWNVLRGEMSLVGPRPIVIDEIFRYGRAFRHYIAVKPGMTGLWQVAGRNDTGYERRVALDRMYAMKSCPGLDVRILFKTLSAVLERRGAY